TKLYATIAIAAAVLLAGAAWITLRDRSASGTQAPPTAVPTTPSAAPAAAPLSTPPAPAIAGFDPRTVEDEVARQLAVRKKEMQKTLEAEARRTPKEAAPTPAATAVYADPEPTLLPAEVPDPAPVEPSPEPTEPPPPPTAVPRPTLPPEPEVTRGELVGPGAGVVEPALLTAPHVLYPPMARQQRVAGKVIILVLVDENGNVTEGRIQQGIASSMGVNEAVLDAVRKAKFRAPTKLGVPVKMWRTVVVDVKP
ncbi:MAG: energy transducer TonB, partial [Thermoanaerobaculia bacterium]